MTENLISKIEKPWAVISLGENRAINIGRLIEVFSNKGGKVQFWESQVFPELWDMDHVKTFSNSKEAANYFFKNQIIYEDRFSRKEIATKLLVNFPQAMKQESIQNFYNALVSYKNKLSSQS